MYKLLLVDDEEEVRQGIINKTRWSDYNFELIGEAANGREALEIIEKEVPDVVITDICMPLLDGLELSKEIKEHYPVIKTIILTGFEDFSFAKKAIKYGVEDYISKPIHPEEISELLVKLEILLDDEIREKEDIKNLQSHYNDSLPILRENFLTSLMHESIRPKYIDENIKLHKLNLENSNYAVAVTKIDRASVKLNKGKTINMELRNVAVLRIEKEINELKKYGEVFFYDNLIVTVFSVKGSDNIVVRNKIINFLEEVHQKVNHFLKITLTSGLGNIQSSIKFLPESYQLAKTALEYRLILGSNKVIYIGDVEPKTDTSYVFDIEKESKLLNAIKFGSEEDVRDTVELLLRYEGSSVISIKEYQLYFIQISSFLIRQANVFKIKSSLLHNEVSELFLKISTFATMDQMVNWFTNICLELRVEIAKKRTSSTQKYISKAKEYIEKNYSDDDLTIQKLADVLFISPSYLSMIFKKEAKKTFLQYLIALRLNKAKELLENPNNSISDVAIKIGYPDISYFSYFFKKNVGLSPREYKKNAIREVKGN